MFSSPSFRVFGHQAQENKDALMARKPGVSNSARKPLGDRAVNESRSLKSEATKPKVLNKPGLSAKKASPKTVDLPRWPTDAFSYKQIEDTYEDILPKSQRINAYDFINMVYPNTPPLKEEVKIDPMFLELPQESYLKFHDVDDEIGLEKNPIADIEFPDFDLFTDAGL